MMLLPSYEHTPYDLWRAGGIIILGPPALVGGTIPSWGSTDLAYERGDQLRMFITGAGLSPCGVEKAPIHTWDVTGRVVE